MARPAACGAHRRSASSLVSRSVSSAQVSTKNKRDALQAVHCAARLAGGSTHCTVASRWSTGQHGSRQDGGRAMVRPTASLTCFEAAGRLRS